MDRGAWQATVNGVERVGHDLATKERERDVVYVVQSPSEVEELVLSHVGLSASPWTVARQAPLSMEFSRQENWSG